MNWEIIKYRRTIEVGLGNAEGGSGNPEMGMGNAE
jgi:hypothetical protein